MVTEHAYLGIGWAVYLALHSILAATAVKRFFHARMGRAARWYRLCYSLFATLAALGILGWGATLPAHRFLPQTGMLRLIAMVVATYGLLVMRLAMKQYGIAGFLGVRGYTDDESMDLQRSGVHRHVRHPLYAGLILVLMGFLLFAPSYTNAITVGTMLIYLAVGIPLEERKLIARFGDTYRSYQKEVPALIPRFRR